MEMTAQLPPTPAPESPRAALTRSPRLSLDKPAGDALLPPHPDPAARPEHPAEWPTRPDLTLLNHASYGLTPRYVRRRQAQIQDLMDEDPPTFFVRWLEPLCDRARGAIAEVVSCDPADIALVSNGTIAVSSVIQNAPMEPGDEILVTSHEYNATLNELKLQAARRGVTVRVIDIPLMPEGDAGTPTAEEAEEQIASTILSAIGERTKLVIVSHLASATSVRFPIERIVRGAEARGVDTLVDGAHGPGHVPLDLNELRPAYYAASCHKWLNAAKGSGFLWVRPDLQERMHTVAQSCRVHTKRDDRSAFNCDFDYVGTGDYSSVLSVPDAIEHMAWQARNWTGSGGHAAGTTYSSAHISTRDAWHAIMDRNAELARRGADRVIDACAAFGVGRAFPAGLMNCMHSLVLPRDPAPDRARVYDNALQDRIWRDHRVQAPVWTFDPTGDRILRVSANLHNSIDQFARLANALRTELEREHAEFGG